MSDTIDDYRALKDHRRQMRQDLGVACPGCKKKFPRANPKILMPGQKCFCGYRDERSEDLIDEYYKTLNKGDGNE